MHCCAEPGRLCLCGAHWDVWRLLDGIPSSAEVKHYATGANLWHPAVLSLYNRMPPQFPFNEVDPEDLIPGNKYYFMVKKAATRKKGQGIVTKLSGTFLGLHNFTNRNLKPSDVGKYETGDFAEFTNVKVEGKIRKNGTNTNGTRLLSYNSGKILNPYLDPLDYNIMLGRKRKNGTLKSVKRPGHQNLNLKTFSTKNWLFNIKKWKFGAGMKNAAEAYQGEQILQERLPRGIALPDLMSRYFPKTNKNTEFKYVDDEKDANENK
jgi:hypothetical protein